MAAHSKTTAELLTVMKKANAVAVLTALIRAPSRGLRPSEIEERLGLRAAQVHRSLDFLTSRGLADKAGTRHRVMYRLKARGRSVAHRLVAAVE